MENSDKGAEARSYCSIGNCLRGMIQPEKALECYNRVRGREGEGGREGTWKGKEGESERGKEIERGGEGRRGKS